MTQATNTAILVDWTLFSNNPYIQDFVDARKAQARLVLLVEDPENNDYEHDFSPAVPDIEWDAVIRNTGGLTDVVFKATALSVIQDASNMIPVIGLDYKKHINELYREGGVLITIEDF